MGLPRRFSSVGRASQRSQSGAIVLTDLGSNPERDHLITPSQRNQEKLVQNNPSHTLYEANAELSARDGNCIPMWLFSHIIFHLKNTRSRELYKIFITTFNISSQLADPLPFMVSIFSTSLNLSFCGGSIVAIKYVLTAFHCVEDIDAWPNTMVIKN